MYEIYYIEYFSHKLDNNWKCDKNCFLFELSKLRNGCLKEESISCAISLPIGSFSKSVL